jgi:hypothetical protein
MNKFLIVAAALIFAGPCSAQAPKPPTSALLPVPFSDAKFPEHFGENCRALTSTLTQLHGFPVATCKAERGVVMLRPTKQAEKRIDPGVFLASAFSASGWAVNSDYYGGGVNFVAGSAQWGEGCRMVSGDLAGYRQDRIKTKKKDMGMELSLLVAESKKVECPAFLR